MDSLTLLEAISAFFRDDISLRTLIVGATNRRFVALQVLVLAGLSEALGQSVVLFANRVRPARFVISLLISALLFVAGVFFWFGSIALVAQFVFGRDVNLEHLALGVAYSYIPLIFGFLALIPYFGQRIIQLLYVYTYVILARMLAYFLALPIWQAILCALIGLVLIQFLRATIGRPIIWLSDLLLDVASGRDFHSDLQKAIMHVIGMEESGVEEKESTDREASP